MFTTKTFKVWPIFKIMNERVTKDKIEVRNLFYATSQCFPSKHLLASSLQQKKKKGEICSKLMIKTPERRNSRHGLYLRYRRYKVNIGP